MIHDPQKKEFFNKLCKQLVNFKNFKELKLFLEDLCTPSELEAMSERWEVAKLIHKDISYRQISEITGTSTATITRIARCIKNPKGGYSSALGKK